MVQLTMSRFAKFAPRLKELRIHLCQTGTGSKGVREFIEEHYVSLKKDNPKFPILIRECSGVEPRLWARHELGKETCISLKGLSGSEVLKAVKLVSK